MTSRLKAKQRGKVCKQVLPARQCRLEDRRWGSTCGQIHPKCLGHVAKKLKDGSWKGLRPCGRIPLKHLEVCSKHGGKSPQALKKVEKIMAKLARDKDVAKFLRDMDVEPLGDPMAAMELAVAEARALYEFWRDRVGQMDPSEMRWRTDVGMEQLRSETLLMERAQERYMKGLETLQKLKKAADDKGGDTILDIIKAGLADR